MNKRNSLLLAFVLFLLLGCGKQPSNVLKPEKMVDVLSDIQVTQAIYGNNPGVYENTSDKDALVNYVLQKHDVTQAELDSSLVWYSDNPDLYVKIHDKVTARLTEKRDEYDKVARMAGRTRHGNDLPVPSYFYLTQSDPIFSFSLDSIQVEKIGTDLYLSLKTLGVNSDVKVYGNLAFEFSDTTLYVNKEMKNNESYKFEKPYHPLGLVRVSGFIKSNINRADANILLYEMRVENKN